MSMLAVANLATLASRRDEISITFFAGITEPSSCLYHLLPAPKEQSVTSRMRNYEKFPRFLRVLNGTVLSYNMH